MTVKELKTMLEHADDNALVCVWSWFEDGERIYNVGQTLMNMERRKKHYCNRDFFCIGGFDNCKAHRPDLLDKDKRARQSANS